MIRRARVLGLAVALALAGCGRDAVRDDLERYARTSLGEVERAERETARELEPLLERLSGGRLAASDALKVYRDTLVPRYDRLVRDVLERNPPATPELAALHAKVIAHYQAVHRELGKAAAAFAKSDWAAVDDAHAHLAKLAFEPLRARLALLAKKHGLELVDPPR